MAATVVLHVCVGTATGAKEGVVRTPERMVCVT